jgi:hypothetical protein
MRLRDFQNNENSEKLHGFYNVTMYKEIYMEKILQRIVLSPVRTGDG